MDRKPLRVLGIVVSMLSSTFALAAETDSAFVPAGYVSVFRDEMEGKSLDTGKWWTRYIYYEDGKLNTFNDEQQRFRENGNHVMTGAPPTTTDSAPQTGPTPYPDPKDTAAWPGQGPIRVFGWMVDNRAFFWTRRQADQGKIVFVGDSLTGNWKGMKAAFPQHQVANRGIGGDVSRGVLFRLKEDVLDLHPKAVVLLIGTNDLSANADPEVVAENITSILKLLRDFDANLKVVLCTLPPRNSTAAPTRPGVVEALNSRIKQLAAGQANVELLDLFTAFANPENGLPIQDYFQADLLHLGPKAYEKWAELVTPMLTVPVAKPLDR